MTLHCLLNWAECTDSNDYDNGEWSSQLDASEAAGRCELISRPEHRCALHMATPAIWQMVIFFHVLFKNLHTWSAALSKWTDCISCSAVDICISWIYIYIYINIHVLISISVFWYGTEKCHICIVWYIAQSCELVIITSRISASWLKRCHRLEELYTTILLGWTLWQ